VKASKDDTGEEVYCRDHLIKSPVFSTLRKTPQMAFIKPENIYEAKRDRTSLAGGYSLAIDSMDIISATSFFVDLLVTRLDFKRVCYQW
jgi:hypothetical protein